MDGSLSMGRCATWDVRRRVTLFQTRNLFPNYRGVHTLRSKGTCLILLVRPGARGSGRPTDVGPASTLPTQVLIFLKGPRTVALFDESSVRKCHPVKVRGYLGLTRRRAVKTLRRGERENVSKKETVCPGRVVSWRFWGGKRDSGVF